MRYLFFVFLSACSGIQQFDQTRFKDEHKVSFTFINSQLTCNPSLVSQGIREMNYVAYSYLEYGDFEISRNDIGKNDGLLEIKYLDNQCKIMIKDQPQIYLSGKDKVLILKNNSTSGKDLVEAFDLEDNCNHLGFAYLEADETILIREWLIQPEEKICK